MYVQLEIPLGQVQQKLNYTELPTAEQSIPFIESGSFTNVQLNLHGKPGKIRSKPVLQCTSKLMAIKVKVIALVQACS